MVSICCWEGFVVCVKANICLRVPCVRSTLCSFAWELKGLRASQLWLDTTKLWTAPITMMRGDEVLYVHLLQENCLKYMNYTSLLAKVLGHAFIYTALKCFTVMCIYPTFCAGICSSPVLGHWKRFRKQMNASLSACGDNSGKREIHVGNTNSYRFYMSRVVI